MADWVLKGSLRGPYDVLPEEYGGTGQTTLQATRNAMGLGDTTGALPIANGGTGATSIEGARSAILNYPSKEQLLAYMRIDEDASETKADGSQPINAEGLAAVLGIDPDGEGDVVLPPVYVEPGKDIESYTWEELSIMVNDPRNINNGSLDYLLGQVRGVNVSGYGNIGFQVVGLQHDDLADGSGKAGMTLMAEQCEFAATPNNSSSINNGWGDWSIRTTLNGNFYNGFSDSVKPYIKSVNKAYEKTKAAVNYSNDYVFIASEMEVFGTSQYDASGTQYEYWSQNNTNSSRIKYAGGESSYWLLRSIYNANYIAAVSPSGSKDYVSYQSEYYVVPCFCI